MFLGYSLTQSAYHCLHLSTGRIYTLRHVKFMEHLFPFATPTDSTCVPDDTSASPPSQPSSTPVVISVPVGSDLHRRNNPSPSLSTSSPTTSPQIYSPNPTLVTTNEPTAHDQNGPQPTAVGVGILPDVLNDQLCEVRSKT